MFGPVFGEGAPCVVLRSCGVKCPQFRYNVFEVDVVKTSFRVSVGDASRKGKLFNGLEADSKGKGMVVSGVIHFILFCPNLGREGRASSAIEEAEPVIRCSFFMEVVIR